MKLLKILLLSVAIGIGACSSDDEPTLDDLGVVSGPQGSSLKMQSPGQPERAWSGAVHFAGYVNLWGGTHFQQFSLYNPNTTNPDNPIVTVNFLLPEDYDLESRAHIITTVPLEESAFLDGPVAELRLSGDDWPDWAFNIHNL